MSLPRYPEYKDSGIAWLGEVPAHWHVQRLKYACTVFPSNVDKHSREDEPAVRLCNYTDVYYNERITSGILFMEATASPDQIARFTLKAGDTIITKDSETADDIAIAAFVPEDLPGVVCGYHLSMVRPHLGTSGTFVKRLFDSVYAKARFAVAANGLTRVGLGQYALDNVELPFPPLGEQTAIAAFLDRETAKIDALIAEQEKLLTLLAEKRQATISHAVTKGLNPDAPMKDSGVEWLGEVPGHWTAARLGHLVRKIVDGAHFTPTYVDEGVPFLRVTDITAATMDLSEVKRIPLDEHIELSRRCRPQMGDLLLSKNGTIGIPRVVTWDWEFSIFVSLCLIKLGPQLSAQFAEYVFRSSSIQIQIEDGTKQSTVTNLHLEKIAGFKFPVPPFDEQLEIVRYLDDETARLDALTGEVCSAVTLLKERRTALISAAVTGKIDVRHLADQEAA